MPFRFGSLYRLFIDSHKVPFHRFAWAALATFRRFALASSTTFRRFDPPLLSDLSSFQPTAALATFRRFDTPLLSDLSSFRFGSLYRLFIDSHKVPFHRFAWAALATFRRFALASSTTFRRFDPPLLSDLSSFRFDSLSDRRSNTKRCFDYAQHLNNITFSS
ncbi:MAG: hypothetical protein ABJB16_13610 [Saprospiraceae bacterium]